ncbi:hypothetical protein ES703_05139 [subsurface metagenome]
MRKVFKKTWKCLTTGVAVVLAVSLLTVLLPLVNIVLAAPADITWAVTNPQFEDGDTRYSQVCELDTNKFVVVYRDYPDGDAGKARVGTVSGTTITWGAISEFCSDVGIGQQLGVCKLDTDKFVVVYADDFDGDVGKVRLGTVSGDTITWKDPVGYSGANHAEYPSCCTLSSTKFAIVYNDETSGDVGTICICTVDGADIITADTANALAFEGLTNYNNCCKLDTDKLVAFYSDRGDGSYYGKACAFSVSTTTPTAGAILTIDEARSNHGYCTQLDTDKFVAAWCGNLAGDGSRTIICTVDGALNITKDAGGNVEFNGVDRAWNLGLAKIDATHFVITYRDLGNTDKGTSRYCSFSGTTITLGDEELFHDAQTSYTAVCLISTNKLVCVYQDSADANNIGEAIIGDVTPIINPPTVTTSAATNVEESTATLNGEVTVVGDTNITERGFVWDTSTHGDPGDTAPALSDYASYWTEEGTFGTGTFNHGVASLTKGELYYVRACAENDLTPAKWGYGNEVTFLTKPDEPTNLQDTARTDNSIDLSWGKGAGAQQTMVRYRTDQYPTSTSDGTQAYFDTGTSTTVESLSSGQIYYFRAWSYATEGGKEQYSDLTSDDTAYTSPGDPATLDASNPSATTIDLSWVKGTGGDKTMIRRKEGSYPVDETDGQQAYFDTGVTTQDSELDPGTTYYYRAWAYDSDSGYYSDSYSQDSETTLVAAPTITNDGGATNITDTTARLRGEITATGGESPTVHIYWGDEDRGTEAGSWDYDENLGIKGEGAFFKDISNLIPETLYYYRCYAVNSAGGNWADSTAQFTTGAELQAPANFTATYVSDYQIDLSWDKGIGALNTLIMANYGSYPIDRNNGYRAYYGSGMSCSDTLVDLQLKEVNVYYRAWSEDGSWSNDYAETNIGGVGMTLLAEAIFILGLSGLAMWRKNIILYTGAFLCLLLFGLSLIETSWMWGLGPLFLAAFMMYQSVHYWWVRRSY